MNKTIKNSITSNFLFKQPVWLLILVSISAWVITYSKGLALSYNDAMSHLDIARLVVDNQQPGLAQLGSVWLPLNHILPLIFIWNDWAWRTGLAATIYSMIAYVVSGIAIFQTLVIITRKRLAGLLGLFTFATNLNILYLQSTPLTEPLYIALFTLSILLFAMFLTNKNNTKYIMILGAIGFFQVITRYDGWFVVLIQAFLLWFYDIFIVKKTPSETFGRLMLFCLPVGFGMGLWFLWNALIFGNPLYFALGPYSAHAQQEVINQSQKLITKGNLYYASLAYIYAMIDNIGSYILLLSLAGLGTFFIFPTQLGSLAKRMLFVILLASPILFNIIALFFGFSILNVPELHWNPYHTVQGQWFNVRYGVLALPLAAILVGAFAGWKKMAAVIVGEILIFQIYLFASNGIVTVKDGTIGSSSFQNGAVAQVLHSSVKPNETVLMSLSVFNPVAFKSGLELKQIINDGDGQLWNNALSHPQQYADWVVVGGNANSGDPVRKAISANTAFSKEYKKVFSNNEATIYELQNTKTLVFHER